MIQPLRSVLYVPLSNTKALAKAATLGCDGLILDLEDAVAPEQKAEARARLGELMAARAFTAPVVAVRVNGLDTPWGDEDLQATAAATPDAILLPKVTGLDTLALARRRLGTGSQVALWAMVETCDAILELGAIARAASELGVAALVMGLEDLAKEMRARPGPGRSSMVSALSLTVTAARAAGAVALDGVFTGLGDLDGLAAECAQGRDFGFDGKTLIHPEQIAAANLAFSPTPDEVRRARAVADAFAAPENAGRGAIRVEGRLAERLHLAEAERILALAALGGPQEP